MRKVDGQRELSTVLITPDPANPTVRGGTFSSAKRETLSGLVEAEAAKPALSTNSPSRAADGVRVCCLLSKAHRAEYCRRGRRLWTRRGTYTASQSREVPTAPVAPAESYLNLRV